MKGVLMNLRNNRENLCIYYIHMGVCELGEEANHWHYCQKCDKYQPKVNDPASKEPVKSKNKRWYESIFSFLK